MSELGVIIESGPRDWQIFQQDAQGVAGIRLAGRWRTRVERKRPAVYVRVVREAGQEAVRADLDWTRARTVRNGKQGTWSVTLKQVPAGGLYRLETCLRLEGETDEWPLRGDMVHHLGVGDLWLIAGQSNATGYGKLPVEDAPELGIHLFHADGTWKLATHPLADSTASRYPANREQGNASHSPWLAFARRLKRERGYPVGLIPTSLGGSAMAQWDLKSGGELFTNMRGYLRDCGSSIRGVLWYQGESDTGAEQRKQYKSRFARFVADLRRATRNPDLPVITVQLNRFIGAEAPSRSPEWEAMREIQRRISHDMKNVFIFPASDAALSDLVHNDSHGNMIIGERAARTALGAVYGYAITWRHPECIRAESRGTQTVELTFAHVGGHLSFDGRLLDAFPFAVRDAEGEVPVADFSLPTPDRIRIELARPLAGAAAVTGLPTANPPLAVPLAIPGFRPMLGFTMAIEGQV